MEPTKDYRQMTVDEQLRYVTDLTTFVEEKLPVLEHIGDAWELSHRKDMETGLQLLCAFQFAREFVDKAFRYGDYAARVSRLRVYFDKVKAEVAKGMSLQGSDGHTYALVRPSVPARRRGRPTKEESEARAQGLTLPPPKDAEMEKQIKIAQLMGINVVVSDESPREKNNAELAADRAARQKEYEKQNPSLFPADKQAPAKGDTGGSDPSVLSPMAQEGLTPSVSPDSAAAPAADSQQPLQCPTMSEVYQDRIEQDRLRLSDLAWLCSDELKARIQTVQALRVTAESSSERAKTMADLGAKAEEIEPYARQAKEAVEGYLAIYAAVDEEMAVLHKRLTVDVPFTEQFIKKHSTAVKKVNIETVLYMTRPYYEKVRKADPAIDARVKLAIEQDNPEFAARLAKEQEEKEEVSALVRYITRKDKGPSDERIKTMTARIERLRELKGDEFADSFLPILNKTIEDNKALHAAEGDTAGSGISADSADVTEVPDPNVSPKKKPGRPKKTDATSAKSKSKPAKKPSTAKADKSTKAEKATKTPKP